MNQEEIDQKYMGRALQIARLGGVNVAPNPLVGAVIVHNDKIIGEGFHQKYGEAHAEVNAINNVADKTLLSSSTIYVTLEPCSHVGKTPPCADLIVKHQLKRVVVGCLDVNPKVSGKGISYIKEKGIEVKTGVLENEAHFINRRFFKFHKEKRPFVILKWAETRDGFIDRLPEERNTGVNWITQSRLKLLVHNWRCQEQAIMVGWKTINNDNPQLNVRMLEGTSPHRFIIDPNGNTNLKSKVFEDGAPTTIISKKSTIEGLPKSVELITLTEITSSLILEVLHKKKILSVFIEGGAFTHQRFIDEGLWDEAIQLIGNVTFGKGIKAPVLDNKVLISTENLAGDLIQCFTKL